MSDVSRRSVIAAGATGLVAGGVLAQGVPADAAPNALPSAAPARPFTTSGQLYSRARFTSLRHARFSVQGPGVSTTMVLVAIDDLVGSPHGDKHHYQLTFRASSRGPEQGTYTLQRRHFDATSMFLVPTDEERRRYLAIVNRGH
ncbi:DUF6916 family protein [Nocardioides panacisoli]|uniref:DUF6916 domain-containing protein n=1 Tax=Nocardioides panacisoli TaxID=627624 RepID=A0ABP7J0A0_9ACTN